MITVITVLSLSTDQAVAVHGEGDGVQKSVDRRNNLLAVLTCRAVLDGETPGYEIILNVNDHKGGLRLDDLQR